MLFVALIVVVLCVVVAATESATIKKVVNDAEVGIHAKLEELNVKFAALEEKIVEKQ